MSTRADIIDLIDNASDNALEKILDAVKQILSEEKGDKIYTIEEIKNKAVPIAKKYGVKKFSLFGSYARGDATAKSDLDFFYEGGNFGGFGYYAFIEELEKEFKCHVDLVTVGVKSNDFLNEIKNDEVILYAG